MPGPPSAPNQPRIAIQMTDEDIISRVAMLLGVSYWCNRPKDPSWKPAFMCHIRGARALELMRLLRPLMGQRRQQQIDTAISSYNPNYRSLARRKLSEDQVREIYRLAWSGEKLADVARKFGISRFTVCRIKRAHCWSDITKNGADDETQTRNLLDGNQVC